MPSMIYPRSNFGVIYDKVNKLIYAFGGLSD